MYNVRAAADEKGIQSIHPKKSKYIKDLNPLNSYLAKIDSKILETFWSKKLLRPRLGFDTSP